MNLYQYHNNPDSLVGYTDRDFLFGDEAKKLLLQGKEVTKVIGELDLTDTSITSLPDNLSVKGDLYLSDTPDLDKNRLPSSLVVKGKIWK